jgi:hypothetical protein
MLLEVIVPVLSKTKILDLTIFSKAEISLTKIFFFNSLDNPFING